MAAIDVHDRVFLGTRFSRVRGSEVTRKCGDAS
jgi:hypothetical protein